MIEPNTPFIATRGSPEFPRFLIVEPHGQVWSGTLWTPYEREGLLFADSDEAATESQNLLREQHIDRPHHAEYLVPILIEVLSDEPMSKEAVVSWLRKALRFEINYAEHGTGPTDGSCVLLGLQWWKIKNRTELK
jgi:hypothetical protein